jgi:peptidoglycan/LPS O-acetylase OafA/YrhL
MRRVNFFFHIPNSFKEWSANVFLLNLEDTKFLLSQAWSLNVELFYYIFITVVARSKKWTLIWFLVSILYCAYLYYIEAIFLERYVSIPGASIAFSLGGMVYFYRDSIKLRVGLHLPFAIGAYFLYIFYASDINRFGADLNGLDALFTVGSFGLYPCLIFSAYLLAVLSKIKLTGKLYRYDKFLGNLAYPIFLGHWLVFLVVDFLFIPFENKTSFFLASFVLINILSMFVFHYIEAPVNVLRERFKARLKAVQASKGIA